MARAKVRPAKGTRPAGRVRRLRRPNPRAVAVLAVLAALALAAAIAIPLAREERARATPDEAQAQLPPEARELLPDEGRAHVPDGTRARYGMDPPTSGPHYDAWAQPDFYTRPLPYELLVHNLEHGHVVVYYDPQRTPQEALDHLKRLTARYRGMWDAVVAVPRPDGRYVLILTAWRHRLRMERYDPRWVEAFVEAYRGRGPENPVR